ncbi:hypothetical protein HEP81_06534 [Streptomyces griseofuscus]|uniref:Uncharacterized protein n=1 Tax=Streptomyces griseofuscus TaxID=146922 RepID=A0A7H1Q8Y9_9ACTN|nr:hypothetical protein [Streptomyces griseofuscus]QNT96769.1 hypothetical protein HEP81_06534 [Streptomyces griseofuscus]
MSDPTYHACACGGTLVVIPARSGVDAKTTHRDADGNEAPCPNDY